MYSALIFHVRIFQSSSFRRTKKLFLQSTFRTGALFIMLISLNLVRRKLPELYDKEVRPIENK